MKQNHSEKKISDPLMTIFSPTEKNVFDSIAFFSGFSTFTFVHKDLPSEKRVTVSFKDDIRKDDNMEITFYTDKNKEPLHHRHSLSPEDVEEILEGFSVGEIPYFFRIRYGEIEGFEWDDFIFRADLAQFFFYVENTESEVIRLYARRVVGGGTKAFAFEKVYYKSEGKDGGFVPFESRSSAYIEDFPLKTIAEFFIKLGEKGRTRLLSGQTKPNESASGKTDPFKGTPPGFNNSNGMFPGKNTKKPFFGD